MAVWIKRAIATLIAIVGVLLAFIAIITVVFVGVYLRQRARELGAIRRFRATWGVRGKDLLLVYSNSPHWQRYVEERWLPLWGHRAVVLNWSQRKQWDAERQSEVELFEVFAGRTEFNPLAIVVPAKGRSAEVVRFWQAFRDFKHGKPQLLREVEAELDRHLATALNQNPEP
jgi:hypothetical protein